jgi:hypothetical protein
MNNFSASALLLGISLSLSGYSSAQEIPPPALPPEVAAPSDGVIGTITVAKDKEKENHKDSKHADKNTKTKTEAGGSLAADISKSCKEREKRLTAMNEAMLKLREAGDDEAAARLEARLQAMIETKDPREDDALVANKAELMAMKHSVLDLTAEIANLRIVLEQNCRIIDEILKKAVPDISSSVIDEMKNQAKKQEVRKIP